MNYRSQRVGHHMLVAWTSTPTLADVAPLMAEIQSAHAIAGTKLEYWLIVTSDVVSMPTAEARAAMQAGMPAVLAVTERFEVVLGGDGVRASLLRSGLRAMAIVSRIQHVTVHENVERALARRPTQPEVAAALRALTR